MADGTHKLKVGFADQLRDIEVALPPGEPKPWDAASKLDVVGKPHPRIEAAAKVSGAARYTHDQRPAGLVHAAVLRSPHPCAVLDALDLAYEADQAAEQQAKAAQAQQPAMPSTTPAAPPPSWPRSPTPRSSPTRASAPSARATASVGAPPSIASVAFSPRSA